jgi:hypothetical protein
MREVGVKWLVRGLVGLIAIALLILVAYRLLIAHGMAFSGGL